MPFCPICEKCLCTSVRKGTNTDRKLSLGSNLRKYKSTKFPSRSCGGGQQQQQQNLVSDSKFGGGIVSTKCGHLFHLNCLNQYITNFRVKGDCYGTTYNVLCPLCGSNLSNGKTLRIDIEAHFGILEEFFQDLCKLKYMNKELKHTLELEWSEISGLEKKIEISKIEYEHVKALKRTNEQRCAAQEERIAKAIEDASTCYRYREIEKQLLDENINLEAVARRMETMISSRLRSKLTSPGYTNEGSSDGAEENEQSPRKGFRIKEAQPPGDFCQHSDSFKKLMCTALQSSARACGDSNSKVEQERPIDLSWVEDERPVLGTQMSGRGHVDISVQISVRSEWSLNLEREETRQRRSHEESQFNLMRHSSLSLGSVNHYQRNTPMLEEECRSTGIASVPDCCCSVYGASRNVEEWSQGGASSCSRTLAATDQKPDESRDESYHQRSEMVALGRTKSYTVRTYAESSLDLRTAPLTTATREATALSPQLLEHVKDLDVVHPDRSQSFTIQVHEAKNNLASRRSHRKPNLEPLFHFLSHHASRCNVTTTSLVKSKPPLMAPAPSRPLSLEQHFDQALVIRSQGKFQMSAGDSSSEGATSRQMRMTRENKDASLVLTSSLNSQKKTLVQLFDAKKQGIRSRAESLLCSSAPQRLSTNIRIPLPTFPPHPLEDLYDRRGSVPSAREIKRVNANVSFLHGDRGLWIGKPPTSTRRPKIPPQASLSPPRALEDVPDRRSSGPCPYSTRPREKKFKRRQGLGAGKPPPAAATPRRHEPPPLPPPAIEDTSERQRSGTKRDSDETLDNSEELSELLRHLVVPPPPPSESLTVSAIPLAVPPPPPMSARGTFVPEAAYTPESTRRLIESLLAKPSSHEQTTGPSTSEEPDLRFSSQKSLPEQQTPDEPKLVSPSQDSSFFLRPRPPTLFENSDSEDELLKSVISQGYRQEGATTIHRIPILGRSEAETGSGDVRSATNTPPFRSRLRQGPLALIPYSSHLHRTLSSTNIEDSYSCTAAERFIAKEPSQTYQSSVVVIPNEKVGTEPHSGDISNLSLYPSGGFQISVRPHHLEPNYAYTTQASQRCRRDFSPPDFDLRITDYQLPSYCDYRRSHDNNHVRTPVVVEHGSFRNSNHHNTSPLPHGSFNETRESNHTPAHYTGWLATTSNTTTPQNQYHHQPKMPHFYPNFPP